MRVNTPRIFRSPRGQEWIRIEALIEYASWWAKPESLWFDLPANLSSQLSRHGDPWLTALLPLAMSLGESIELAMPISPEKRANARALMSIWHEWYRWLKPIEIVAQATSSPAPGANRLRGSFFSGGLDSSFTLIHNQIGKAAPIDELIFIQGLDMSVEDMEGSDQLIHQFSELAGAMGVELICAATNLRETRFQETHYDLLSVGSALGATGLLLAPRYHELLISSTWATKDLHPLGSHPISDPLLSNDITRFRHYGESFRRFEKAEFLLNYPASIRNIRVCWEQDGISNCGRCLKCLRTMAALEILGGLQLAESFKADTLDLEFLSQQVFIRERRYFEEIHYFAQDRGRLDIAAAIESAFDRTDRVQRLMLFGLIPELRSRLLMRPVYRRVLRPMYHRLRRLGVWLNRQVR